MMDRRCREDGMKIDLLGKGNKRVVMTRPVRGVLDGEYLSRKRRLSTVQCCGIDSMASWYSSEDLLGDSTNLVLC